MSTLAVITYPQEGTAAEAAASLARMQESYLIQLDDIAWVTKKPDGKLKLHQGTSLTGAAAAGGAFWGFLFGLIFLVPLFGMAVGAATGALAAKLSDFGIDDKWIKDVAGAIPAGGSALAEIHFRRQLAAARIEGAVLRCRRQSFRQRGGNVGRYRRHSRLDDVRLGRALSVQDGRAERFAETGGHEHGQRAQLQCLRGGHLRRLLQQRAAHRSQADRGCGLRTGRARV